MAKKMKSPSEAVAKIVKAVTKKAAPKKMKAVVKKSAKNKGY